jgi:hypothetical protein
MHNVSADARFAGVGRCGVGRRTIVAKLSWLGAEPDFATECAEPDIAQTTSSFQASLWG